MMTRISHKGILAAMLVATALMVAGGIANRVLARRLDLEGSGPKLSDSQLAALSKTLGPWKGQDTVMDEKVIEATDAQAHISRQYRKDGQSVAVFIGYSRKIRRLRRHIPRVCYIGTGWALEKEETVQLPLPGGATLPCLIQQFTAGGKVDTVLSYCILDGRDYDDPDNAPRGNQYMLKVQINSTGQQDKGDRHPTEDAVRDFTAHCAPELRKLIDRLTKPHSEQAQPNSVPSPGPASPDEADQETSHG